jgi:sodium-dependent dicarboxylate transporter 2/3/5
MMLGVPVVIVLFGLMYLYMNHLCPAGVRVIEGHHELLRRERDRLGAWTAGQISTVIACAVTVVLWVTPGVIALTAGEQSPAFKWITQTIPEAVPALIGASLLFILPGGPGKRALSWPQAAKIDWGVVLLYGGGFALGTLAAQTGLAGAIGKGMTAWLPLEGGWTLLVVSTVIATLLSETTSNTAAVNIIVPVVIAVAKEVGADPLEPALGATMGASLGFMLPVSTPCNAIVYGSGHIPLGKMIRYGALLDVIGVSVIIVFVHFLVPLLR